MAWFHEHRSSFNLVQFAATEERFAPVVRHNRDVAIADAVRHIKDGIVEGRIADGDPEVLAEAVVGVTERLAQAFLLERDGQVDPVADAAVAFCLTGLTPGFPDDRSRMPAVAAGPRGRVQPSLTRALRMPRSAWPMRCSFSTRAKRTKPSPPGPNPTPGATATFASCTSILANSRLPSSS